MRNQSMYAWKVGRRNKNVNGSVRITAPIFTATYNGVNIRFNANVPVNSDNAVTKKTQANLSFWSRDFKRNAAPACDVRPRKEIGNSGVMAHLVMSSSSTNIARQTPKAW